MKRSKSGFTVVELLTVIGIVALLVGVLLPAVSYVRRTAKEAKQKVQFTTIDLALTAFNSDYRDYPPSDPCSHDTAVNDYCGSQKLAEALLGRDLLGFNKYSNWSATDLTYYPNPADVGLFRASLENRVGPYLELTTANAFRIGVDPGVHDGLFDDTDALHPDRYVLCDVFNAKKITIINESTGESSNYNAGTPVLYFKANTLSKAIIPPFGPPYIYDVRDNEELIGLGRVRDGRPHFDSGLITLFDWFHKQITDPKVSTLDNPWPYRPDSYILISAGADGLYGTADDITNF